MLISTYRYVQTQLRDLHKEQHQDIAELLQELKHLLLSNREPTTEVLSFQIPRDLDVPIELSDRFAAELCRGPFPDPSGRDEIRDEPKIQLSVKDGLDIFFNHFNGVRDPGPSMDPA